MSRPDLGYFTRRLAETTIADSSDWISRFHPITKYGLNEDVLAYGHSHASLETIVLNSVLVEPFKGPRSCPYCDEEIDLTDSARPPGSHHQWTPLPPGHQLHLPRLPPHHYSQQDIISHPLQVQTWQHTVSHDSAHRVTPSRPPPTRTRPLHVPQHSGSPSTSSLMASPTDNSTTSHHLASADTPRTPPSSSWPNWKPPRPPCSPAWRRNKRPSSPASLSLWGFASPSARLSAPRPYDHTEAPSSRRPQPRVPQPQSSRNPRRSASHHLRVGDSRDAQAPATNAKTHLLVSPDAHIHRESPSVWDALLWRRQQQTNITRRLPPAPPPLQCQPIAPWRALASTSTDSMKKPSWTRTRTSSRPPDSTQAARPLPWTRAPPLTIHY